jgi:hypothetical protein
MMNFFEELFQESKPVSVGEMADGILDKIRAEHQTAQEQARGMFGAEMVVDEMAVWFPRPGMVLSWITEMVSRPEFHLFNAAGGIVNTSPISSTYEVQYWFMDSLKDNFRIEAMCLLAGYSPYHSKFVEAVGGNYCAIAHASFKVNSEEEFANAGHTLRQNGYEVMQHCTSEYGRFSYYVNQDAPGCVLKPRLNTRDA